MLRLLNAVRAAKFRVFYPLHRRYRPGDYETWKYIAPIQKITLSSKAFEYGTWGGEIRKEFEPQPGEIVIQEHWGSSGFANTDLATSRDCALTDRMMSYLQASRMPGSCRLTLQFSCRTGD